MNGVVEAGVEVRPFELTIPEERIEELRRRIAETRWPSEELVPDRSQGVQLTPLRELARYWGGEYDAHRVADRLNLPVVTGVKAISVQDGSLRCEQEVAGGRDVYVVPMPAVVTVKEGINLPRYPSVPGRLRAKRKPLETSTPARPEPRLEMVKLTLPPGSGKQAEILGEGPGAAPAVVGVLHELGLV